MGLGILLLFIAVPLIELALLIKLGTWVGVLPTVALVILTAVVGTFVLRQQGLQTMMRLNEMMARGEPPVGPVVEGALLLLAGAFLLTPGILTDSIGFLLLIPPVRQTAASLCLKWLLRHGSIQVTTFGRRRETSTTSPGTSEPPGRSRQDGPGPVIEGEFERLDERTTRPGSGTKRSN
ncbi:MAG: FxsA family protein [Hyphomicrobiaceae bacterium]|nr:FxsA family protein [Hyphomicrobiaceae bacterium]